MTPDELTCTTCEGEGAVIAQQKFPLLPQASGERVASGWYDWCLKMYGVRVPWQVDACPECGRGGEVGRL